MNLKNCKREINKKNLLAKNSNNQVESRSDVYGNIFCTSMKKEANLSNLHHHEEKDTTKLFYINIHVKKTNIDALFDSGL